jgi:hypothetical protein
MIEVFKTNVENEEQAGFVRELIRKSVRNCEVCFDLDDCDRVLRIKSEGSIDAGHLIRLLGIYGFEADVLPDEVPAGLVMSFSSN